MNRLFGLLFLLGFTATPALADPAPKEWTFLLFLNGNNNLDSFGALNINQMEKVGSSDQVNMVVEWASMKAGGTKRLYIQKDNDANQVTSPVVQDMGKVDMGDYRNLEDFIRWGVTNYPAKHYFVAVWDHGSGWRAIQAASRGEFQVNDISWDDNTGHSITTKQLGQAMNEVAAWMGRKIDIYGSDACLMGMAEIAGEMKNSVGYFLGSQDLEPGEGWPYTDIFAPLVANPTMAPRDLAKLTSQAYGKSYSAGGSNSESSVTMAAYDMAYYDALKTAVSNLGAEVLHVPNLGRKQVAQASKAAQSFDYSDYVDFGDFLKKLHGQSINGFDQRVVSSAQSALASFVISSDNTGSFAPATGLSIWIPGDTYTFNRYKTLYQSLQFDQDTRWSEVLQNFVGQ